MGTFFMVKRTFAVAMSAFALIAAYFLLLGLKGVRLIPLDAGWTAVMLLLIVVWQETRRQKNKEREEQ